MPSSHSGFVPFYLTAICRASQACPRGCRVARAGEAGAAPCLAHPIHLEPWPKDLLFPHTLSFCRAEIHYFTLSTCARAWGVAGAQKMPERCSQSRAGSGALRGPMHRGTHHFTSPQKKSSVRSISENSMFSKVFVEPEEKVLSQGPTKPEEKRKSLSDSSVSSRSFSLAAP